MTIMSFANTRHGTERQEFDAMLLLLGGAVDRGGMLFPLPASVVGNGIDLELLLHKLIDAGLIQEVRVAEAEHTWRASNGQRYGLQITPTGCRAIGFPALRSGAAASA